MVWDKGTILGREVVPEVCSTRAISSAWAKPPLLRARRCMPSALKREIAGLRLPGTSVTSGILRAAATAHGRAFHALQDHQRLGIEIGKIEIEFLGAIGGIERRGGGAAGNGDEGRRHFRPVGQHHGDAVAAPDAHGVEACDRALRQFAQVLVRQRGPLRRADGRRLVTARLEQVFDGARRDRCLTSGRLPTRIFLKLPEGQKYSGARRSAIRCNRGNRGRYNGEIAPRRRRAPGPLAATHHRHCLHGDDRQPAIWLESVSSIPMSKAQGWTRAAIGGAFSLFCRWRKPGWCRWKAGSWTSLARALS